MMVQVLLAIHNPNMLFFKKQLRSLNEQSYKDIEVVCCDDCSEDPNQIRLAIGDTLRDIRWRYIRNDYNLGCNKTFEKLVQIGSAKYFAFCDQDDIWHKHKIEKLTGLIEINNSALVYSDLQVINHNDQIIAKSLRLIRKRLSHLSGDNLWHYFIRKNSVTGCTALVSSDVAKSALPFPQENIYIWDHWLAIWASHAGTISNYPAPMVNYRIHDKNLVGAAKLQNIHDRQSYIDNRIETEMRCLQYVQNRFGGGNNELNIIQNKLEAVLARKAFLLKPSFENFRRCLGNIIDDPLLFIFELLVAICPQDGAPIIRRAKKSLF